MDSLSSSSSSPLCVGGGIRAAVECIRCGSLTPTDLVEQCLSRIRAVDSVVGGAWVLLDEEGARREAERLTTALLQQREQRARGGDEPPTPPRLGPLYGIPIGIKDVVDVAGWPTRAGSPLRTDAPPAERDAPVVAALRKAGAILLGKTVTTEWACMDPPVTLRNPWRHYECTPGGSSSGSAVAVASGMCWAALGTQTAGSIIRPASYCGVSGLKPTFCPESIMSGGIVPISFHLDHIGPLARQVDDLWILHSVMTGGNGDSTSTSDPPILCRLEEYFWGNSDNATRNAFQKAVDKLQDAKWEDAPKLPDSFATVHEHHSTIMGVDAAQVHVHAFQDQPEQFSPKISALIQQGLETSLPEYVSSLRHQQNFFVEMARWMRRDDLLVLIMPSTPATAPGPETTGDARFNLPWSYCGLPAVTIPCGVDDERGMPVGLQLVARPHGEAELLRAAAWCQEKLGMLDYQNLSVVRRHQSEASSEVSQGPQDSSVVEQMNSACELFT